MIKTKWNIEAAKAYETGQGVELVNEPYPHYIPKTPKKLESNSKEWVGLTEDEVYKIAFTLEGEHWKKIADAIQNKLKEKNT